MHFLSRKHDKLNLSKACHTLTWWHTFGYHIDGDLGNIKDFDFSLAASSVVVERSFKVRGGPHSKTGVCLADERAGKTSLSFKSGQLKRVSYSILVQEPWKDIKRNLLKG